LKAPWFVGDKVAGGKKDWSEEEHDICTRKKAGGNAVWEKRMMDELLGLRRRGERGRKDVGPKGSKGVIFAIVEPGRCLGVGITRASKGKRDREVAVDAPQVERRARD